MFQVPKFWPFKARPDVNCKRIKKLAYDYLERKLDSVTTAEFEKHLLGCESCEQFIRTYRAVTHPNRLTRDLDLDPEFEERILHFLEDKWT